MQKKIVLTIFILLALAQLYIPAKMIFDKEDILLNGTEYKFKIVPIDPNDPFRGKYITLNYKENTFVTKRENNWKIQEAIYVILSKDTSGFATIIDVSKEEPLGDYVKAKVGYMTDNKQNKLVIDYPFDRYYMEEAKANETEIIYQESLLDTNQTAFALIKIKDGNAVIKDVIINGTSIQAIAKKEMKTK